MLHYALSGDNLAVEHCIGPQPPVPDLSRKRQIAVGTAGRQPQVPDRSGHYRTSAASAGSPWADNGNAP